MHYHPPQFVLGMPYKRPTLTLFQPILYLAILALLAPTHAYAAPQGLLANTTIASLKNLRPHKDERRLSRQSSPATIKQNKLKLGGHLGNAINHFDNNRAIKTNAFIRTKDDNVVQVYFKLKVANGIEIDRLRKLGADIELVNSKLKKVQGWINVATLNAFLSLDNVLAIKAPKYATAQTGQVNSQGDAILRANQLRNLGFRGQGIKVGVISDGANSWTTARDSGDLPANLTRYGSCTSRARDAANCVSAVSCNEGTAMAEIIHDLAPDAQIAVAAAATSLEFIQRINQLATTFGANIIVDDLSFFGEPYFEDGDLADAVAALPSNILFISSAGNSGNSHYEAQYNVLSSAGINAHNFAASGSPDDRLNFIVPARGFVIPTLQWNDPFDSPANDYDLYIVSQTAVIGTSTLDQSEPDASPLESVCAYNPSSTDVINFALIDRVAGAAKRLELFFVGSPAIEHNNPLGSIFGHAGLARTLAIGTINANEPGNDSIAPYSSRGPARVDFPSRQDRAKPDLIGIDGVSVSGAGGFGSPFFGTSAAAPHVAAVAAQLMSVSERVTATNIRDALTRGAVDLGSSGNDSIYGYGRVDAIAAKAELKEGTVLPPLMLLLDN